MRPGSEACSENLDSSCGVDWDGGGEVSSLCKLVPLGLGNLVM